MLDSRNPASVSLDLLTAPANQDYYSTYNPFQTAVIQTQKMIERANNRPSAWYSSPSSLFYDLDGQLYMNVPGYGAVPQKYAAQLSSGALANWPAPSGAGGLLLQGVETLVGAGMGSLIQPAALAAVGLGPAPAPAGTTLTQGLLDTGVKGLTSFGQVVTPAASTTLTSGLLDTGVASLASFGTSLGETVGATLSSGFLDTTVAGLTAGGNTLAPPAVAVGTATEPSVLSQIGQGVAKEAGVSALKAFIGGAAIGGSGAAVLGTAPSGSLAAEPTITPTAPTLESAAASLAEGPYEQQRKQRLMTGKASTIFTSLGMAGINDQRTNKRFLGV